MKYEVLDSSGLAFGFNFTGQKLDYVADYSFYGVQLKQPSFDINGKRCPVRWLRHYGQKECKTCGRVVGVRTNSQ